MSDQHRQTVQVILIYCVVLINGITDGIVNTCFIVSYLCCQNLCIESATPLVALTESQLKEYLEKPPRGLDPVLWAQGKRDNPDPKKYLPVSLVGFRELQARFKYVFTTHVHCRQE